ncbi:hypothetical protein LAZ67_20001373 [Cordylochernes scorpioides]|uniref:Uncharacterized protein n=1 Tax=Cordylochernes scorpioides TaxID=51811 RepID=A0ABY6LK74_9ARAC|nr:hypothetical protein LAZ67_20001373 [Cordylochernes scorpioides]
MVFLVKSLGSLQRCPTYQDPPITVERIFSFLFYKKERRRVTRQPPDEVVAFKDCNQSYLQCLLFLLGRKWREKKTDHSAIGGEIHWIHSQENVGKIRSVG